MNIQSEGNVTAGSLLNNFGLLPAEVGLLPAATPSNSSGNVTDADPGSSPTDGRLGSVTEEPAGSLLAEFNSSNDQYMADNLSGIYASNFSNFSNVSSVGNMTWTSFKKALASGLAREGEPPEDDEEYEYRGLWFLDFLAGKTHALAWAIAGICTFLTIMLTMHTIHSHLKKYHLPTRQRYIIRILWMAPIYSLDSFLSLLFISQSYLFDIPRDIYESYVIYNFMALCIDYMGGDEAAERYFQQQPPTKHLWPFSRCFDPHNMKGFLWRCKLCTLQYSLLKPVTAAATVSFHFFGAYRKGDFDSAYLWITVGNNVSACLALYYLALFYSAGRNSANLQTGRPFGKFLSVKLVIFFSFWQTVSIYILAALGIMSNNIDENDKTDHVQVSLVDFLICVEMLCAALVHPWVFSAKEHQRGFYPLLEDDDSAMGVRQVEMDRRHATRDMFTLSDVAGDIGSIACHYKDEAVESVKRKIRSMRGIEEGEKGECEPALAPEGTPLALMALPEERPEDGPRLAPDVGFYMEFIEFLESIRCSQYLLLLQELGFDDVTEYGNMDDASLEEFTTALKESGVPIGHIQKMRRAILARRPPPLLPISALPLPQPIPAMSQPETFGIQALGQAAGPGQPAGLGAQGPPYQDL